MSKTIKLRKGFNITLEGEAEKVMATADLPETFAIKPTDFHGIFPKLLVKEGDEVKAGTPLFYDKNMPDVKFTSPVSGEVIEIKRGAKRKVLEVKVLADKNTSYESFTKADPSTLGREEIIKQLLGSGIWPLIRQRPFGTIANPEDKPRSIFISAFDTHPLAPDNDFIVHGQGDVFQTGLDAIAKLTDGKVHLNVNGSATPSKVFTNSKNVQINQVSGPHPAGNVGVQIHHIEPINKGEVIWYLYPQDVLMIGNLFREGKFDASRIVAVAGSEVKQRKYFKTLLGANIKNLVKDNVSEGNNRYISGNVLTGSKISPDGYLGFYDCLLTVIPEGDEAEFMGWLIPSYKRPSLSRTFLSTWMRNLGGDYKFKVNTNLHGEPRAYVMTGQFEKVLPMDVYPLHLIKSILVEDVELMENLGIYEVLEEDLALCEFVDTSKTPIQRIVRKGLDLIKKEMF